MNSPYEGYKTHDLTLEDINLYMNTRDELLNTYPLNSEKMIQYCKQTLENLAKINNIEIDIVGEKIKLNDLGLHGSTYGGIIDRILSTLIVKNETGWKKPSEKRDKDVVYEGNLEDNFDYSLEIKSCGQKTTKVFGNASSNSDEKNKEEKSMDGYYLTINYYKGDLYLIRFGWLDRDDWQSQDGGGQQAWITDFAYQHKLKILYDDYILNTPIQLINYMNLEQDFIEGDYRRELKDLHSLRGIFEYKKNNEKILKMKYTFLLSASIYLTGNTKLDLLEYLNQNNNKIKEFILEQILNVPLYFLKTNTKGISHDLLLKDIIEDTENNLSEKKKRIITKFIKDRKLTLKTSYTFQKGTYTDSKAGISCEFDINHYLNYNGTNELINKFKKILSNN